MKDEIKFIEYNGIEGYIELMKHDVEPLNNPEVKNIELYYNGKDIKALLDYITDLQEENERLNNMLNKLEKELTHKTKQYEFIRHRDNILYYENIIDKAIEYIKSFGNDVDRKNYSLYFNEIINKVLNILTGGEE